MTERLHFHFSLSCIGEGNGNPLQCSCLENPRDGKPGGLPSMGSHRVGHDWSYLAAAEESLFEMQPKHLEELIWVFPHLYIGICDTLWSSLASFPSSLKTVNSSQELSLASHHWTCRACTAHASLLNSFIYTWLLIILGWPKSSFRFVSKIVPKTSTNFLASEILLALCKHLLHAGPHSTHLTFIIQLSLKNPLR